MGTQFPLPQKGAEPPNFRPMSTVATWSPNSATAQHLYIIAIVILLLISVIQILH